MNKKTLITSFILCLSFHANADKLPDGLYYSYWNYESNGETKEYPILKNKPEKQNGKYILSRLGDYGGNDEIYIDIKNGKPKIFYTHANNESLSITRGWANASFVNNQIVISPNTIVTTQENDTTKNSKVFFVGDIFDGKNIPLARNEIVPYKKININSFKVDCNKYLDVNNYREGDIPEYSESISGDKNVLESFGGTVFINGEQLCALFLDDDIAPEIKHGWITFKKIGQTAETVE